MVEERGRDFEQAVRRERPRTPGPDVMEHQDRAAPCAMGASQRSARAAESREPGREHRVAKL